jgi:hypothetical protein
MRHYRVTAFDALISVAIGNGMFVRNNRIMVNIPPLPIRAIGISWFREEDYPTLLRLFTDANKMPHTWKEWLEGAEKMGKQVNAQGVSRLANRLSILSMSQGCPSPVRCHRPFAPMCFGANSP